METLKKYAFILLMPLMIMACKNEPKEVLEKPLEGEEMPVDSIQQDVTEVENPDRKTVKQIKDELTANGYETFDYIDEKTQDTILMQKYFMVFLKSGPIRSQNEEEAAQLQKEHLAHLGRMYEEGYADISGPFDGEGDLRGVTIYNVPTLKMADSLANLDPMVKAGRLVVEVKPWWAAKGFPLR